MDAAIRSACSARCRASSRFETKISNCVSRTGDRGADETQPDLGVFGGGIAATFLVIPAAVLLPDDVKKLGITVVAIAVGSIYLAVLSKSLVPRRDSVALSVDPSGVYANGAPLAVRADITQAYIRPAIAARTGRMIGHVGGTGGVPMAWRLRMPEYPLTVELLTRVGQFNIDPGGQVNAAAVLSALGFPATMCEPSRGRRYSWKGWLIVGIIVALFLAGAVASYIYVTLNPPTYHPSSESCELAGWSVTCSAHEPSRDGYDNSWPQQVA